MVAYLSYSYILFAEPDITQFANLTETYQKMRPEELQWKMCITGPPRAFRTIQHCVNVFRNNDLIFVLNYFPDGKGYRLNTVTSE
jgi:hypothetical protein